MEEFSSIALGLFRKIKDKVVNEETGLRLIGSDRARETIQMTHQEGAYNK